MLNIFGNCRTGRIEGALLAVVVGAAIAEFLLLRVFLRLGQFLPAQDAALPVYHVVQTLGLAALNLAMLAAAVLVLVVVGRTRWKHPAEALTGVVLVGAVIANLGLGALLAALPAPVVVTLHALVTMAAVAVVAGRLTAARGRATIALVATAQVLTLYHVLTQGAAGLGVHLPGAAIPTFLAETAAVLAALAAPWSFRMRPWWRQVTAGVVLAVAFFVFHALRPWTVATMTMWTVSFSLFLPGLLYAAGLGAGTAALLALRREPDGRWIAAGLLLVALAGLKLDFTYFALLSLAGLLAACRVIPEAETAHPVPAAQSPRLDAAPARA